MTLPPSCHAASLWSTPTLRTSPSSTKETGWSNDDWKESKRRIAGNRGQRCSGAPIPKSCSPHLAINESLLLWTKARTSSLPTFPPSSFFFFFSISSYLCLVVVCVRRGISVLFLSVSSVSKRSFLQSVFSALPHDLVSDGFLVMKSPMFTIVIHKKKLL